MIRTKQNNIFFGLIVLSLFLMMIPNTKAQVEYSVDDIKSGTLTDAVFVNSTLQSGIFSNGEFNDGTKFFRVNVREFEITEILYEDPTPPEAPSEPSEPELDLIPLAERINTWLINPFFWIVVTLLCIASFRYYYDLMHQPYVWVRDSEKLRKLNLGRFIEEEPLSAGKIWRYTFKTSTAIKYFYSDRSFSEYQPFLFHKLYEIIWEMPDLIFKSINVPSDVIIDESIPKKNVKNFFLKLIYRFLSIFGIKKYSKQVWDAMDFERNPLKKIDYLICLDMMEQLDFRFDIKYEKFELNQETGDKEFLSKNKKNISWSEVLAIKKNNEKIKDDKIEFLEIRDDKVKFTTIREALQDKRSRLMDRANYESRKLYYEKQVEDTFNLYRQTQEEITTLKLSEEERFHEAFRKIDQVNTDRTSSLPELLSEINYLKSLGVNDKKAIEKAILKKLDDDFGENKRELELKNARLETENSVLQRILDKSNQKNKDNEIVVRNEYSTTKKEAKING